MSKFESSIMLYSSSHACLFLSWIYLVLVYSHELLTCVWESKILMYYICLLDDILWLSWHFHLEVTTCSLKALTYRIPLSLMLWRGHSVIPKSCHHHVMRPLNSMFALNPNTWSGNLLCLSILLGKTQHCAFLVPNEQYLAQHRLYPIFKKQCHRLWSLVQNHFSSKPLCHKGRKAVP